MGHPGRVDRLNLSKPRLGLAKVLEQPRAGAAEDRPDREEKLVERPGGGYCCTTFVPPPLETSFSPAATRACSSADSMPSVTN
jgi:hypothetical protein